MKCAALAALVAAILACAARADDGSAAGEATVILRESGPWRAFCTWKTPVVRKDGELVDGPNDSYGPSFLVHTPPPPAGWTGPQFDDAAWSPLHVSTHNRVVYGFNSGGGPALALECLRARFQVDDPAAVRGMTLALEFRGGAVVYLNGTEILRAHLPAGELAADAPAEDLPAGAFETAPGKCIMSHAVHDTGVIQHDAEGLALRIRRAGPLAIRPELLRKGTNCLAVEVHRAPYYGDGLVRENLNHGSIWSTCGLVRLALAADAGAAPNTDRPAGVQVFATDALHRSRPFDYADPLEPPRPVSIAACRNGSFVGKVTVASDAELTGVSAAAGDLVQADRKATIPAADVRVFYSVRDDKMLMRHRLAYGFWDTLLDAAPDPVAPVADRSQVLGAIQPILVKVRVPADAAPGEYAGTLTVRANGESHPVPLRVRVADWRLPDPADFVTHVGLVQSPDTVALQYNVPTWSAKHIERMEPSFRLMAEVGNKYLVLPFVCRTNFGNSDTMVRWIRDGDSWRHDFTVLDQYLDLALKYFSPQIVCLYVWDIYMGQDTWGGKHVDGKPPRVTGLDPATGGVQEIEVPGYDTPEGKEPWARMFAEVLAHLQKRGLRDRAMLGINSEWFRPVKGQADFYKETFPGMKWICNPHQDCRGGAINGIPIGYHTSVYVGLFPPPGTAGRGATGGRYYGWQTASALFPRSGGPATRYPLYPASPLGVHRVLSEAAFLANFAGVGRTGIDFWPVLGAETMRIPGHEKRSTTVNARYVGTGWSQLNMDAATESLSAPGPAGAVPTERFEQFREGVQVCEARAFIEKALLAGTLDAAVAEKCQAVLDERAWQIRAACIGKDLGFLWFEGPGRAGLTAKLFDAAAEVAKATAAP